MCAIIIANFDQRVIRLIGAVFFFAAVSSLASVSSSEFAVAAVPTGGESRSIRDQHTISKQPVSQRTNGRTGRRLRTSSRGLREHRDRFIHRTGPARAPSLSPLPRQSVGKYEKCCNNLNKACCASHDYCDHHDSNVGDDRRLTTHR